jgi:hypothetical protein
LLLSISGFSSALRAKKECTHILQEFDFGCSARVGLILVLLLHLRGVVAAALDPTDPLDPLFGGGL